MNALRAAIVPCLFALAAWYCLAPDYFYSYGDPDFGYMLNSLRITEGMPVWHVDHPGTVLQLLGAFVIATVKLLKHMPDGLLALIANLTLVYFSTVALSVITLSIAQFVLGWTLLRRGYGFLVVLAAQLTPALFVEFPFALVRVNSETTLAATGLLVAAAFVPFLEPTTKKNRRDFLLLGCAIGAAMTTKANVWPIALLAAIPLFSGEKKIKDLFLTVGSAALTFAVITIPAWPRYGNLFGWKLEVFLHNGRYATGTKLITTYAELLDGLKSYIDLVGGGEQLIAVAISVLLITGAVWQRKKIYVPVLAAFLFTVFLLMKHPATRYAVALVPLMAISILSLQRMRKELKIFLAMFLICLAAHGFYIRTELLASGNLKQSYQYHFLSDALNGPYAACAVLVMGPLPLPQAGLIDGSGPASVDEFWTARLNALFPRYFVLREHFTARFGQPIAWIDWTWQVNRFPCQVFVAPNYWRTALSYATSHFAETIEDISPHSEKLGFQLFHHGGALTLRDPSMD